MISGPTAHHRCGRRSVLVSSAWIVRSAGAQAGSPLAAAQRTPPQERRAEAQAGCSEAAVRRQHWVQPARCGALHGRRPPAAGAAVPLHHPSGTGQRTRANQRRRAGGAQAQDPVARRHYAPGAETGRATVSTDCRALDEGPKLCEGAALQGCRRTSSCSGWQSWFDAKLGQPLICLRAERASDCLRPGPPAASLPPGR
jgi:hypothetical protein